MNVLAFVIAFLFEQFASYFYLNTKFEKKKSGRFIFLMYTASFTVQFALSYLDSTIVNLSSFFICNAIIAGVCFETTLMQNLFNVFLLESIQNATELTVIFSVMKILNAELDAVMSGDAVLLYMSAISKTFYFVLAYFLSKVSNKRNERVKFSDFSMWLFILPLTSILTIISFIETSFYTPINSTIKVLFIVTSIVLLFSSVIVFFVHERTVSTLTDNAEYQLLVRETKMNNEHYAELQRQQEISAVLVHDIKRHLNVIRNMSAEQGNEDITKYVDSVYESTEIQSLRQFSSNKLVNVVVNRYATLCKNDGIRFNSDIRDVDLSFVAHGDLTALLDNLLENAYEAGKEAEDKFVDIRIDKFNDFCIIILVKNSFLETPKQIGDHFVSSKKNTRNHGIGIRSIKRITKKYNGEADFDCDSNKKIFTAKVAVEIHGNLME